MNTVKHLFMTGEVVSAPAYLEVSENKFACLRFLTRIYFCTQDEKGNRIIRPEEIYLEAYGDLARHYRNRIRENIRVSFFGRPELNEKSEIIILLDTLLLSDRVCENS